MSTSQPSRLKPCPGSPNCVCSLDPNEKFRIEPFVYEGDGAKVWDAAKEILEEWPHAELLAEEEDYMKWQCRSLVMKFKDDLELWHDTANRTIHFRSASRVGYSDFGANRRRVESLKSTLCRLCEDTKYPKQSQA